MILQHSTGSVLATPAGRVLICVRHIGKRSVDKNGSANGLLVFLISY